MSEESLPQALARAARVLAQANLSVLADTCQLAAAEIERLAARVRELERERAEVMDVPPLPSG